jgi:formylglycine-generating enzyme required for sulfatase activity
MNNTVGKTAGKGAALLIALLMVTAMGRAQQANNFYTDPESGIWFAWVPGGYFSTACRPGTAKVWVPGFWMGVYEVSQGEWANVMGNRPARFNQGDDYPVEQVSFWEVQEFIKKLNQKSGRIFSLPTEAQWEYACSGGHLHHAFAWGTERFFPRANCGTCNAGSFQGRTAPVGSFLPNDLGLYDMGGNVREWCQQTSLDPDKEKFRVVRGGSFADNASQTRCAARHLFLPGIKTKTVGFRLVLIR